MRVLGGHDSVWHFVTTCRRAHGPWYADWGNNEICRIKAGPYHKTNKTTRCEFLEQEIALVCLYSIWEGMEGVCRTSAKDGGPVLLEVDGQ